MDRQPPFKPCKSSELEAGDLFLCPDRAGSFYGLKVLDAGSDQEFVVLGPDFSDRIPHPCIRNWSSDLVLSLGKSYCLDLPAEVGAWSDAAANPPVPMLAVVDGHYFVRANGAREIDRFFPCFVELETGRLVERSLSYGTVAYTQQWGLSSTAPNMPPKSLLLFGRPAKA
jgi:hypothetical protein